MLATADATLFSRADYASFRRFRCQRCCATLLAAATPLSRVSPPCRAISSFCSMLLSLPLATPITLSPDATPD